MNIFSIGAAILWVIARAKVDGLSVSALQLDWKPHWEGLDAIITSTRWNSFLRVAHSKHHKLVSGGVGRMKSSVRADIHVEIRRPLAFQQSCTSILRFSFTISWQLLTHHWVRALWFLLVRCCRLRWTVHIFRRGSQPACCLHHQTWRRLKSHALDRETYCKRNRHHCVN